jgi:hypothetical protein
MNSGPASPGLRTARGNRTREALVSAARRVCERDGYLDARIVDTTAIGGAMTAAGLPLERQAPAPLGALESSPCVEDRSAGPSVKGR